eukprot:TRINITY_DN7728_c3_g1_i1.p1 TRINITY_DN7728_c3_g1~~TRINITY_DN7728_c3_g1_i1.p1  ORF type:complete len:453 (+),score=68.54 TRINITY_DN7728_c3_g1_i1:96-1454(+)
MTATYTSFRELAKAKRNHTTVIGSPTAEMSSKRSVSGPSVPHPCIRPAPGPEHREWKYQSQSFISEGAEKLPGGFTSNQDLHHEKHLGLVQIPLGPVIPSNKVPQDPTKPRFNSLRELDIMKKYHASSMYPTRMPTSSQTRSRTTDGNPLTTTSNSELWARQKVEANEWSSWTPKDAKNSQDVLSAQKRLCTRGFSSPKAADEKPVKNEQNLYISQDRVRTDKVRPGGTTLHTSISRCRASSEQYSLDGRHVSQSDFASEKNLHLTAIGESPSSSSRPSFSKRADHRVAAAGVVCSPTKAVIFKADGSNYPPTDTDLPKHMRNDNYLHLSHDQLSIEKQTSSTPMFPVTPPIKDPPPGSPTVSQRRVEREVKKHVRPIEIPSGDSRFEAGRSSSPHRTHRKLLPSTTSSPVPRSPCRSPVSPGRISYNSPLYRPGSAFDGIVPPPKYVGIRS